MKKLLFLIIAATAFSLLSAAVNPEARRAFRLFEQRAAAGDPEAQYRLAAILEKGWDSIPADSTRALALIRESAQAHFPPAMNYLGYLYGTGYRAGGRVLLAVQPDSARTWLQRSADCDDPRAMSNLAYLLLNPEKDEKNTDETEENRRLAIGYLERAASQGVPTAISMLADLYREGNGVPADTLRAAALYEQALSSGFGEAEPRLIAMMGNLWQKMSQQRQFDIGLKYYTTYAPGAGAVLLEMASGLHPLTGTEDNGGLRAVSDSAIVAGARHSLEISARAKALLGIAASRGIGLKYDHERSMRYFAESALAGNPSAMFILSETDEMFPDAAAEAVKKIDPEFIAQLEEYRKFTGVDLPHTTDLSDAAVLKAKAAVAGIKDAQSANRALYIATDKTPEE